MQGAPTGYEGRIGRYGPELAASFLAVADVQRGQRALDVGCGSGALTEPLAELVGSEQVVGVDPDAKAVAACRSRLPQADVRVASAEELPFGDSEFDVVLAQLVMSLLSDADAGVGEMRRVARPGAVVATCVWDFAEGMTVLRTFWDAATSLDPAAARHDQARTRPYGNEADLRGLWHRAGLQEVETGALDVGADYADFDDLWHPLVAADGSPGAYYETLEPAQREALRQEAWRRLGSPAGPFRLTARAWYVRGRA